MRLVLALAPVLFACLLCSPVLAHGSYNTSDYDWDNNNTILYYKADLIRDGFHEGMGELKHLHDLYPMHAPDWRQTHDRSRAEVIVQWAPKDNFFRNKYQCGNSTYVHNPGPDTMNLDPECRSFRKPVMHEGSRLLGMADHSCATDPYVSLVNSPCMPDHFTRHDRRYVRHVAWGY